MKLWANPTYQNDGLIIESTWNHDIIGPMIDYLLHDVNISRHWDNKRIESTFAVRSKSKKGDFQGFMQSSANKSYNYEIIFGETSYGPNHPNNSDHIYEDEVRLAKFGRISFESIYDFFPRRDREQLKNINIFLIQSHGYFVTLSIMDSKFFPFCRIRSMEKLHVPSRKGPNSLEYVKKIVKALYSYHLLVNETVKYIDNIDIELAAHLGSETPSDQIRTAIPIFETP